MNTWKLLSHTLSLSTPGYGGSNSFSREIASSIANGNSSNSEIWRLSNHIGTHVDCPFHFSNEGKKITDYTDEEWFFKKPFLVSVQVNKDLLIDLKDVRENIPFDNDCLIIKTGFEEMRSDKNYWNNNPGLSPELGEWLRSARPKIKIIGFDFISLTAYQHREVGRTAHRAFLAPSIYHEGIRIIEDMKLSNLYSTPEKILVSPIFVNNADGSPVTVWSL